MLISKENIENSEIVNPIIREKSNCRDFVGGHSALHLKLLVWLRRDERNAVESRCKY